MPRKTYVGKKLKKPLNGPQTVEIPNPAKKQVVHWDAADLRATLKVIRQVTDVATLDRVMDAIEQQWTIAIANDREPETVTKVLWTGSVQLESVVCGKEGCKCRTGSPHGPYWYHYS